MGSLKPSALKWDAALEELNADGEKTSASVHGADSEQVEIGTQVPLKSPKSSSRGGVAEGVDAKAHGVMTSAGFVTGEAAQRSSRSRASREKAVTCRRASAARATRTNRACIFSEIIWFFAADLMAEAVEWLELPRARESMSLMQELAFKMSATRSVVGEKQEVVVFM